MALKHSLQIIGSLLLVITPFDIASATINCKNNRPFVIGVIPSLGGSNSVAHDISDAYIIVGESDTIRGETHAFVNVPWSGVHDLGVFPGGDYSSARAINKAGVVVGIGTIPALHSTSTSPLLQAFTWQEKGKLTALPSLPGAAGSVASDINSSGQIVGASGSVAVLWEKGQVKSLGTLGGKESEATAINDDGIIVGSSDTKDGRTHAFIYSKGQMRDIGTLGGLNSFATGVDKKGRISGNSETETGQVHPFIWTEKDGFVDRSNGRESTTLNHLSVTSLGAGGGILSDSRLHALLWDYDGNVIDLHILAGYENSYAMSVNDGGMAVGYSFTGQSNIATYWNRCEDAHLPAGYMANP